MNAPYPAELPVELYEMWDDFEGETEAEFIEWLCDLMNYMRQTRPDLFTWEQIPWDGVSR